MAETEPSDRPFLLAGWRVDPDSGEMQRGDELRRLEPKVLHVLLVLAARPGAVVSKPHLLDEVWDGIAVSDDAVWRCIAALRRAFDDDSRAPRVIETVGHRGYRLVARPQCETEPAAGRADGATAQDAAHRSSRWRRLGVAATLAIVAAATWTVASSGRGATDEASALTRAVRGDKSGARSADDFHRLGVEYYERRSPEDDRRALEQFERAIEIDPEHVAAWTDLANTQARLALGYRGETADSDAAVAAAERAVELAPRSAAAHKALGYALTTRFEIDAAIAAYRHAIEIDPSFEAAVNNLGALLTSRGRYAEALEAFRGLETGDLTHVVHLHNVGDTLLHLGRVEEAREVLDATLELDPLQALTIESRVRVDLIAGDLDAAAARAERALTAQPDAIPVRNAAADVALARDELDAARAHLAHGVGRAGPGRNLAGRMRLAWVLRELGEETGSAEVIARYAPVLEAEVARRGQWWLAELRAELALAEGDSDAALDWLERAAVLGHFDSVWRAVDPVFAALHDEPRFRALLDGGAASHGAGDRR